MRSPQSGKSGAGGRCDAVTLDTNEYISALNGGKSVRLLHMAIDGEIEIALSEPIVAETLRVLRQKFEWPPYMLHDVRFRLQRIGRIVDPKVMLSVLTDEPDNRILECAIEAGSEYIVTEDKAMLRLGRYAGIKIIRFSDLLRELQPES